MMLRYLLLPVLLVLGADMEVKVLDTLSFKMEISGTEANFVATADANTWFGVGVSPDGKMANSDIFLCSANAEGYKTVTRHWLKSYNVEEGVVQSDAKCEDKDGQTVMTFSRDLAASGDEQRAILDGDNWFIGAHGSKDAKTPMYHGQNRAMKKVTVALNVPTEKPTDNTSAGKCFAWDASKAYFGWKVDNAESGPTSVHKASDQPAKHDPAVVFGSKDVSVAIRGTAGSLDTLHPMTETHWIGLVWLEDQDGKVIYQEDICKSKDAKTKNFNLPDGVETVTPWSICNLHGVWQGLTYNIATKSIAGQSGGCQPDANSYCDYYLENGYPCTDIWSKENCANSCCGAAAGESGESGESDVPGESGVPSESGVPGESGEAGSGEPFLDVNNIARTAANEITLTGSLNVTADLHATNLHIGTVDVAKRLEYAVMTRKVASPDIKVTSVPTPIPFDEEVSVIGTLITYINGKFILTAPATQDKVFKMTGYIRFHWARGSRGNAHWYWSSPNWNSPSGSIAGDGNPFGGGNQHVVSAHYLVPKGTSVTIGCTLWFNTMRGLSAQQNYSYAVIETVS